MAISLYDISVSNYLQVLGSTSSVLSKGAEFASANGLDLAEIVDTKLRPDMLPFSFQAISVFHHSLGTVRAMKDGLFAGPPSMPDLDYSGLHDLVDKSFAELQEVSREEIDALEGTAVKFKVGDFEIPFTIENYVLSFSLPNLYFHATTLYDMLRMAGTPLGKIDFLGQMRVGS